MAPCLREWCGLNFSPQKGVQGRHGAVSTRAGGGQDSSATHLYSKPFFLGLLFVRVKVPSSLPYGSRKEASKEESSHFLPLRS
jgi:hypothetical protein